MPAVLATPVAATNTAAQLVRAVGLTLRRSSLVRRASLRHAATTVATWVREVEVVVVGATQRSSELEACCLFSFVPLYRGRTLSSCLTVAAQRPFIVSYTVHFGLGVCRLFDAHRSQCACVCILCAAWRIHGSMFSLVGALY